MILAHARNKRIRLTTTYPLERRLYFNAVELDLLYSFMQDRDVRARRLGRKKHIRDYMIMDLLLRATMNPYALCRIDYEHIDLERKTLVIPRLGARSVHNFHMSDDLTEHLRQYLTEMEIDRGPLFSYCGKRVKYPSIRQIWFRTIKEANFKYSTPFIAKYTFLVNVYFQTDSLNIASRVCNRPKTICKKLLVGIKKEDYEKVYHLK